MEIKDIVSANLTKYPDISSTMIDMVIAEVTQEVLNYCDIDEIPTALNFVCANMSVDLLKYRYEDSRDVSQLDITDVVDAGDIQTIKEGDVTLTFGSKSGSTSGSSRAAVLKGHKINLDELILNYREQLQQFRRLH